MSDDTQQRMKLQSAEFAAAEEFAVQLKRHSQTTVVDDDYPSVRHDYESALAALIEAMKRNGRFQPSNRYGLAERQQGLNTAALDSERLDYLERHPRSATVVIDGNSVDCCFYGISCAHGMKLRDVLDQLRKYEKH